MAYEEGVGLFLDERALDLFGGAVALGDLDAVGDPAQVELGHGRTLAGVDIVGNKDDVELVVDIDDIALAQGAGDYFGHGAAILFGEAVG